MPERSPNRSSPVIVTRCCRARRTVLAAAIAAVAGPAAAVDTVWFGGSGTWDVVADWSLGQPGAGDVAVINAGSVTLGFDTSILGLRQTAGTIGGTGALTVTGASTWSGGTMTGAGSSSFAGVLAISGNAGKGLTGTRVLNLSGATTWGGNTGDLGNTIAFNNGTINNGGSFVDSNGFDALVDTLGASAFNNSGSLRKTGASTTTIEPQFNNTGSVAVDAGTLRLQSGTSSGSFAIANGARTVFVFGTHTLDNATVSGAGTFEVGGGTVVLNGGSYAAPLLVSAGNLGGSESTFSAAATWTGGTLTGAGTTTFTGPLVISGNNGKGLTGTRVLELQGTTTWSGNTGNLGNTIAYNNGTINNHGSFVDSNGFDALIDTLGASAFNNSGSLRKTGAGTTTIEPQFNNAGSVAVDAGTLRLQSGTSSGSFAIANGARTVFVFGTHTLNNATVGGAGTLEVGGANVVFNGGHYSAPLLISAGNLGGTESTFSGPATWTGGTVTGAGTTTFAGPLAISGNNGKGLTGTRVLNLKGTTTWSGNTGNLGNTIGFGNGTINNSGTFVDGNGFAGLMDTLGVTAFNNGGTYRKLGAATTTIEPPFVNTGLVEVAAGILDASAAFDNLGTITTAAGATFGATNLSRDLQNHGLLLGYGTYDPATGRTLLNAGAVDPGSVGGVGHLTVAGNFTQPAAGAFDVDLAGLPAFDLLSVTDNVTLGGAIVVRNAGYVPVVGDSFVVMTFAQRLGASTFAGVVNQGYGPDTVFEAIYHANDVTLRVAAVPEPAGWAMLLSGIGWIAFALRRRQR